MGWRDAPLYISPENDFRGVQGGSSTGPRVDPMSPAGFYGGRGPDGELVTEESAKTQALAGLGTAAAGAAVMGAPLIAALAPRAAGAAEGYRLGSKGSTAAGLPGAVGGVPGAIAGAILPGTVGGAGIAEQIGTYAGGPGGGLTGLAAAILIRKYGGSLGKLLQGRFAPQIMAEGMQAGKAIAGTEKAAEVTKGVNPEMLANIEKVFIETGSSPAAAKAIAASEAARGASGAAEAVSTALPGVVSGAKPLSQESLKQIMQLQAMAKQGGSSRKTVAALAKELFPDNPEVVEMITGPMTTMSTIHVP